MFWGNVSIWFAEGQMFSKEFYFILDLQTFFPTLITVFTKVKIKSLWTIVRVHSLRWFLWRNMRFCLPFKEFTSSLYYCDSPSECKAISRYSLWTAVSDLLYQATVAHGVPCSILFHISIFYVTNPSSFFEVNNIIRRPCWNIMTLGPIWSHRFCVLISELERHVAIIWKIQVKTSPKNITRCILITEKTALWYNYSVCYLYKMFILYLYIWAGGLIFQCHIFYLSILFMFMGFSWQQYWSVLPFVPPVDHVLPELFIMTHSSWVALRSTAHSFIELCKPFHHDKSVIHEGIGCKYICVNGTLQFSVKESILWSLS